MIQFIVLVSALSKLLLLGMYRLISLLVNSLMTNAESRMISLRMVVLMGLARDKVMITQKLALVFPPWRIENPAG